MEMALKIVDDFGKVASLCGIMKKTKAISLGKWTNNNRDSHWV